MIKYITGDIFSTKRDIIAHGCNVMGGFGSGMAGEIKIRHPEVREAYREAFERGQWALGMIQPVKTNSGLVIVNMATQRDYKRSGDNSQSVFVNYEAVRTCFRKLFKYMKENNFTAAIPKVGAGLARGDWLKINEIILEEFQQYENELELDIYSLK